MFLKLTNFILTAFSKGFQISYPGPKNKCNDKFICKWIKLRSREREHRDRNRLSRKIQVSQKLTHQDFDSTVAQN